MAGAYYNEVDPFAAEWLRQLMKKNAIAPGDVDERDIRDVKKNDLKGYTQCHFFAGIGVWSHSLRESGWEDNRPIWSGSCPCTPFSSAGRKEGFKSEAHLWPVFFDLIRECRPPIVVGEQVAQRLGQTWFDVVQSDLTRETYSSGLAVYPAGGVGAPHLRLRLYWFAKDTKDNALEHTRGNGREQGAGENRHNPERKCGTKESDNGDNIRTDVGIADATGHMAHSATARPQGESGLGKNTRTSGHADSGKIIKLANTDNKKHGDRGGILERGSSADQTRPTESIGSDNADGMASSKSIEFMADSSGKSEQRHSGTIHNSEKKGSESGSKNGNLSERHTDGCKDGQLANADSGRIERESRGSDETRTPLENRGQKTKGISKSIKYNTTGNMANTDTTGLQGRQFGCQHNQKTGERSESTHGTTGQSCASADETELPGPTNGYWASADWLWCRDEKWRPVRPGTFPLAHGITGRVGKLRGYGNAIVGPAAKEFLVALQKVEEEINQ